MSTFSKMETGRPSATKTKTQLMEDLKDDDFTEPMKRVNFELAESKHRKLKVHVAKSEHKSIKEFLTAYIESLPNE